MNLSISNNKTSFTVLILLAVSAFAFQISSILYSGVSRQYPVYQLIIFIVVYLVIILVITISGLILTYKNGFIEPLYSGIITVADKKYYSTLIFSAITGIILALIVILNDFLFFGGQIFDKLKSLSGSSIMDRLKTIYVASVGEEILFRLFILSLILFILSKLFKNLISLNKWLAIIISGLLFGLAHYSQISGNESILNIIRTIILNGIGGVVFGWLFYYKGIIASMIAHILADFIIYMVVFYMV